VSYISASVSPLPTIRGSTESASWPRRTRIPMALWCLSEDRIPNALCHPIYDYHIAIASAESRPGRCHPDGFFAQPVRHYPDSDSVFVNRSAVSTRFGNIRCSTPPWTDDGGSPLSAARPRPRSAACRQNRCAPRPGISSSRFCAQGDLAHHTAVGVGRRREPQEHDHDSLARESVRIAGARPARRQRPARSHSGHDEAQRPPTRGAHDATVHRSQGTGAGVTRHRRSLRLPVHLHPPAARIQAF
jgi:hypothetical protein